MNSGIRVLCLVRKFASSSRKASGSKFRFRVDEGMAPVGLYGC